MGWRYAARAAVITLALTWLAATGANAAGLNCKCENCTYKNGRTQAAYAYNPNFNATLAGRQAYNGAEQAAMNQADQAAIAAIAAAMNGLPSCPDPCDPEPVWDSSHGPPFAGGTGGNGIARSLWKVTYSCLAKVVIPPPPVLVAVSTTCPACQQYIDQIHALDSEIMHYYETYVKALKAREDNAGFIEVYLNDDEGKREDLIRALRNCENACPRPAQFQSQPYFGGFYFGGGRSGDFGEEDSGGNKNSNNKGRWQK